MASKVGIRSTDLASILSTYTGPESALENIHAYADVTGTSPAEAYASQRLLGLQFGEKDYAKSSDILAIGYARTGLKASDMGRAGTTLAGMDMSLAEGAATVGTLKQATGYDANIIGMTLANANAQLMKSSAEADMVLKKGKAGKDGMPGTADQIVQATDIYGKGKMKYEGLGKEFADAGLDVEAAKAKGLEGTLVDMYTKGIDFSTIYTGKQAVILEAYAAQQANIQGLTREMENSSGAALEMGGAIDETLTEMTEEAGIAVDTAKANFGSLFDEPSKDWQSAVKTMADSFSGFVDRIKEVGLGEAVNELINSIIVDASGVGDSVISTMLNGITEGAGKLASGIYDTLAKIDYEQVGWALYDVLHTGWDWAVDSLERLWTATSFTTLFTNPINAFSDAIDPMMASMKLTIWRTFIEIQALSLTVWQNVSSTAATTFNSVIDSIGGMVNTVVGGIGEVVATAIERFASLVGAAGTALGGKIGFGTAGVDYPDWGESSEAKYQNKGTGEVLRAKEIALDESKSAWKFVSALSLNSDALNENTLAYRQYKLNAMGEITKPELTDTTGSVSIKSLVDYYIDENPVVQTHEGWTSRRAPGGETYLTQNQPTVSNPVPVKEVNPTKEDLASGQLTWNENYQRMEFPSGAPETPTTFPNAGSGTAAATPSVADSLVKDSAALTGMADDVRNMTSKFKSSDYKIEVIPPKTYEQNLVDILAASTDYNRESLEFEKAKLDSQEKAREAIEKLGGDNKDSLARIDAGIQATKTEMGSKLADSVAAPPAHIPGLYYGTTGQSANWQDYVNEEGGYGGPTKYYPGYGDVNLQDRLDAAMVNANPKYGIHAVGQAYSDVQGYMAAGSIGQEQTIKVTVDDTAAKPQLDAMSTTVNNIVDRSQSINVGLDTTRATQQLNVFLGMIAALRPVITAQVRINADASSLMSSVEAAVLEVLGNRGISI